MKERQRGRERREIDRYNEDERYRKGVNVNECVLVCMKERQKEAQTVRKTEIGVLMTEIRLVLRSKAV